MEQSHTRYCESCAQEHGILFVCDSYDDATQKAIQAAADAFRRNLHDPEWEARQIATGTDPVAIAIYRALAG